MAIERDGGHGSPRFPGIIRSFMIEAGGRRSRKIACRRGSDDSIPKFAGWQLSVERLQRGPDTEAMDEAAAKGRAAE
ncbi:MAG TPA: hypothetical protein VNF99_01895 [Stellaceae bacterium]|nr:hypothetical protein [Stellaceae bacterium]